MKTCIAFRATLLWGVLHLPAQAAAQPTVPGCPYMPAPAESLVIEGNHHLPSLTVWPRSFPRAYSGCAYLWFGTRLYSIARLSETKAVEGVIENLIEAVFDDSDLPPMVYCKTVGAPDESDCDRFRKLWTEEFPAMIGEINKRSGL